MAKFNKAVWRPISKWNAVRRLRLNKPSVVVFHIAVSNSSSLFNFFSNSTKACSHFYVNKAGIIEQYVDTSRKSAADYNGNWRTISIETEGGVGSDLNVGWNDAQCEALAQIAAWAHTKHGVPLRLMNTSRKSESGIGYHRLGVPGYKASDGEQWSGSYGKVCPGSARIAQTPSIVARAQEIVNGAVAPTVPPVTQGEIDLAKLPVLKRGDEGAPVKRLQGLLLAAGFGVGSAGIDGDFGGGTEKALIAFQLKHPETGTGGKPDAVAGQKVWAGLLGV